MTNRQNNKNNRISQNPKKISNNSWQVVFKSLKSAVMNSNEEKNPNNPKKEPIRPIIYYIKWQKLQKNPKNRFFESKCFQSNEDC